MSNTVDHDQPTNCTVYLSECRGGGQEHDRPGEKELLDQGAVFLLHRCMVPRNPVLQHRLQALVLNFAAGLCQQGQLLLVAHKEAQSRRGDAGACLLHLLRTLGRACTLAAL